MTKTVFCWKGHMIIANHMTTSSMVKTCMLLFYECFNKTKVTKFSFSLYDKHSIDSVKFLKINILHLDFIRNCYGNSISIHYPISIINTLYYSSVSCDINSKCFQRKILNIILSYYKQTATKQGLNQLQ